METLIAVIILQHVSISFATLYDRFLGFLRMDFDPLAHEFTSFVTESMYTYNILLNSADMHAISQVSVSASI